MVKRRKQRVVLRAKVRDMHRRTISRVFSAVIKLLALVLVVVYGGKALHKLFFRSDFFMVKSVEVAAGDEELSAMILNKLAALKGRSILRFSASRLENDLKYENPGIKTLSVRRIYPDKVRAVYKLREPVACTARGNASGAPVFFLIDEEGVIFDRNVQVRERNLLPEFVVCSTGDVRVALNFLKAWSIYPRDNSLQLSTASLCSVNVDQWGEITLDLDKSDPGTNGTRIIWGGYDPKTFAEKFARFQDVWQDLQKKSMKVEYVDLRDVPQEGGSGISGTEMVGRVVVRPSPAQKRT